jgi:hypothetical protein
MTIVLMGVKGFILASCFMENGGSHAFLPMEVPIIKSIYAFVYALSPCVRWIRGPWYIINFIIR